MTTRIWALSLMIIILLGCSANSSKRSEPRAVYRGPIIDMHIHALTDDNPLLGLEHPQTLRG